MFYATQSRQDISQIVKTSLHFNLCTTVLWLTVSLFNDNAIADTPIRIKRIIVEKSEIAKRWDEEVALVKKEMANFIAYYMDVSIPHLTKIAEELQGKLDS